MKERLINEKQLLFKTIFAFSFFILAFTAGYVIWKALRKEPKDAGVQKTLRKGLASNEKIFSKVFDNKKLVATYPKSQAVRKVRVNGREGLRTALDTAQWNLSVVKKNGDTLLFTMDDIKRLPKTEVVFDFKCIEGWSQVTHWAGVKFSDFAAKFNLNLQTQMKYVGFVTPDKRYYVGIDMPSIMHPQTLLCYEMNGKPLPMNQGYPLRLIIPVKYGIKHLKRIGTISFSNQRPPDYWYEQGYDYYSGL